jgi:betaine reductase
MDPENQDRIRSLVDEHGADDVVVVLGAADLEALEVAAETVTLGDPAYVGPLAGVQLGLPVVHILEEDVKQDVDPAVWDEQVGLLEMTLDVERIQRAAATFPGRDSSQLSS